MAAEKPKWRKSDGTDERLSNPMAYLVGNFHHYDGNTHIMYEEKTDQIEKEHPEFVQKLLAISDQSRFQELMDRSSNGGAEPSADEFKREKELALQKYALVKEFVITTYGSVEKFLDWWHN